MICNDQHAEEAGKIIWRLTTRPTSNADKLYHEIPLNEGDCRKGNSTVR